MSWILMARCLAVSRITAKKRRALSELLDITRNSLKAFGEVTPRKVKGGEPLPQRGVGVQKDGSATFAITFA